MICIQPVSVVVNRQDIMVKQEHRFIPHDVGVI